MLTVTAAVLGEGGCFRDIAAGSLLSFVLVLSGVLNFDLRPFAPTVPAPGLSFETEIVVCSVTGVSTSIFDSVGAPALGPPGGALRGSALLGPVAVLVTPGGPDWSAFELVFTAAGTGVTEDEGVLSKGVLWGVTTDLPVSLLCSALTKDEILETAPARVFVDSCVLGVIVVDGGGGGCLMATLALG